jgi:hypothetical protein
VPAVDERGDGTCALNLGVSDTSVIVIDTHRLGALAAADCDKTEKMAEDVLEILKAT